MTHDDERSRARLDIFVHQEEDAHDWNKVLWKLEAIMATQAELATELGSLKTTVDKIGAESTATLAKVTELEAALAAAGNTSPEVDAALAAVKASVQAVDDMVADAPTDPTP